MEGSPDQVTSVFVRFADESDAHHVDRLCRLSRVEATSHRGVWREAPGASETGRISTLVGGFGETVLGVARAKEGDSGTWVIDALHVEDVGRGVGIGNALLTALLESIATAGGLSVAASAQPGDRSLKNLFERHGLVARTILVGRELS